MSKYLLLYTGGAGMMETEDARNAEMARWGEWYGRLSAAVVDGGNPFGPAAKRLTSDGRVSNGASGEMATGYTIISQIRSIRPRSGLKAAQCCVPAAR